MNPPQTTRPEDRVSIGTKLAYGAGGMATLFLGHLPKNLATPIFVVTMGLSPSVVGFAMLVFRFYEALINPLTGWISDNTRSRWGRRRPYLFVGSILSGLFLPLMWFVSPGWSPHAQIAWFVCTGLVLYTVCSVFAMPYESLNLELTPDYNERTSVTSYKAFFQKIAFMIVGWAWFITQLPYFTDPVTGKHDALAGARALSVVVGLAIIGVGLLPAFFVKERFYGAVVKQAKISLGRSLKLTFGNKPFLLLSLMTVFFACSYYLSNFVQFYLRLYYVTKGDQALAAKIEGVQATLTMILGVASIPCFAWLAKRIGKTWTLMFGMALTLLGMVAKWWTYNPEYPWLSMVNAIILAPSLTGIWQIIPAMTADICDHDELRTGERREGAFASIFSLIVKVSFTLGLVLAGPLVEWCGLNVADGVNQTAATIITMRIADAIIPSALLIIAMLLLYRYPLSPGRMREIRADLETRRGVI